MRKSILIPPIPEPDDLRLTRTTQAALDKEFKDIGKAYGRYNRVNLPTKAYLKLRDLAAQAPSQDIAGTQECHVIIDDAVRLGDTADVLSCDSINELPHPNASSTAEAVQSNRDPVIPDHDFNAQEYSHRFQFDNFRTQYRQYRRTPEYKLKQKEKKKAIEKSRAAPKWRNRRAGGRETNLGFDCFFICSITQIVFLLYRVSTTSRE
ncbi:unnamed protein product [Allacma fusca]|uniref:Uncharacterized protein n=1 Tax=Allacma fusca TaxID=39272 RepID=A0A8J2NTD6_9HEXA|nr:unnamed protein product [Allacma fusca]